MIVTEDAYGCIGKGEGKGRDELSGELANDLRFC